MQRIKFTSNCNYCELFTDDQDKQDVPIYSKFGIRVDSLYKDNTETKMGIIREPKHCSHCDADFPLKTFDLERSSRNVEHNYSEYLKNVPFPRTLKTNMRISLRKTVKLVPVGMIYGLISGLFFSLCGASVKYLNEIDPGQVAFYQYVAIACFSLPFVIQKRHGFFGTNWTTRWWILLCGLFDAITIYLSFMSFRLLPLSDATVLTSTVPVFVTISARIFLKERCSASQVIAIVISVAGVALVSKLPVLISNRSGVYNWNTIVGLLASIGSIVAESGVYIVLRKLHDVNVFVILFNFGWLAALINGILTGTFGSFTFTNCGPSQWVVIAVGVFSFLSQMMLAMALEKNEAGPISVLMAAGDIMLAFVLDITLFQDMPDEYTVSGTALVVASVIIVGFKKWLDNFFKHSLPTNKFITFLC